MGNDILYLQIYVEWPCVLDTVLIVQKFVQSQVYQVFVVHLACIRDARLLTKQSPFLLARCVTSFTNAILIGWMVIEVVRHRCLSTPSWLFSEYRLDIRGHVLKASEPLSALTPYSTEPPSLAIHRTHALDCNMKQEMDFSYVRPLKFGVYSLQQLLITVVTSTSVPSTAHSQVNSSETELRYHLLQEIFPDIPTPPLTRLVYVLHLTLSYFTSWILV